MFSVCFGCKHCKFNMQGHRGYWHADRQFHSPEPNDVLEGRDAALGLKTKRSGGPRAWHGAALRPQRKQGRGCGVPEGQQ